MNNMVLRFLENNRERLELRRFGAGGRLAGVMQTPRFHASGHVVFLVLADGRPEPVLVAKVPRLAGPSPTLEREADNLRRAQALRPGGWPGIPRLLALEACDGWPILVETALVGRAYDRAGVRRDPAAAAARGAAWLAELAEASRADRGERGIERWVQRPLAELRAALPLASGEMLLLERTLALVEPLGQAELPAVFEHGDFSAPNVMRLADGQLGVVDWELAEPEGLPVADLFFWLSYVAFARAGARTLGEQVAAFRAAFFGPSAWARPYVMDYAARLGVAPDALTPLFVATWARYVAGLVGRLAAGEGLAAAPEAGTLTWLRGNRYFALWRTAVSQADALAWAEPPYPAVRWVGGDPSGKVSRARQALMGLRQAG
jgi:aminoglycoside phosphotransferase